VLDRGFYCIGELLMFLGALTLFFWVSCGFFFFFFLISRFLVGLGSFFCFLRVCWFCWGLTFVFWVSWGLLVG
jgi:hypothetical protein